MSKEEMAGIAGLSPNRQTHLRQASYIKDAELQIHTPRMGEPKQLDDTYSFKALLGRYLDDVNTLQHDADAEIQRLVAGETEDLHQVTLAMDEAEASFELMMEIRTKLLDAYQDLMRMQ